MCTGDHIAGTEHGGFKTKCSIHQIQIIINGFRNSNHRDRLFPATDFSGNIAGAAEGSVPPDTEKNIDVQPHQRINHGTVVLIAARASENGAPVFLDGVDDFWIENNGRMTV